MIGDTAYDIEAARKVHVRTIAFRSGGWKDADLAGALAIYDGPADLLAHYDQSQLACSNIKVDCDPTCVDGDRVDGDRIRGMATATGAGGWRPRPVRGDGDREGRHYISSVVLGLLDAAATGAGGWRPRPVRGDGDRDRVGATTFLQSSWGFWTPPRPVRPACWLSCQSVPDSWPGFSLYWPGCAGG